MVWGPDGSVMMVLENANADRGIHATHLKFLRRKQTLLMPDASYVQA